LVLAWHQGLWLIPKSLMVENWLQIGAKSPPLCPINRDAPYRQKKEEMRKKKGRDQKKKDQKMTSLHPFEFVEDAKIFLLFSLKRNHLPFLALTTTLLHLNCLFHLFS